MPPLTMVRMVLTQLLLGGSATTRDFLGNIFHRLILDPDLHQTLRDDRTLVPAAVEEGLRLMPPVLFVIRTCREAIEVDGVRIEPGERVIAAIAAANRDAEIYPEPDAFRVDRTDPAPHFSFGMGSHFCVGSAVARMEITHALHAFVDRVPPGGLKLAPGFALQWMPTPFLFGPRSVDVRTATA